MMMQGISQKGKDLIDVNVEWGSPSKPARTLVLVGRSGNGKSATGNSILGRKAFKHGSSSVGVTKTCELQTAKLEGGQIINVIDTPGLSGFSTAAESIAKEILGCLTLAKQGIDAILLIFSARSRLSQEEEYTLRILQTLFGSEIVHHVIVVFTGGDDLEDNEEKLDEFLDRGCPKFLKEFLELCDNRLVLFDNKTQDKHKKTEQVDKLLTLVDSVVRRNGGKPYMDELLRELQMEQQLAEEQAARIEAEKKRAKEERKHTKEVIRQVRYAKEEEEENHVHELQRKFIRRFCKFL